MYIETKSAAEQENRLTPPVKNEGNNQATDLRIAQENTLDSIPETDADRFENNLNEATKFILGQVGNPVDVWAVAATLESRGERDIDAVERYGKQDIFDLAQEIYIRCRIHLRTEELVNAVSAQTDNGTYTQTVLAILENRGLSDKEATENFGQSSLAELTGEVQRRYRERPHREETEPLRAKADVFWFSRLKSRVQKAIFAAPATLYFISLLILGNALWAYAYISHQHASTVALSLMLSLMVAGGFVQAISHLVPFYLDQGFEILPKEICSRLLGRGLLAVVIIGASLGVFGYIVNFFVHFTSQTTILNGLIYYFLLAGLWLFLATLYTLQQRQAFLVVIGGFLVTAIFMFLTPRMYLVHWLGLGITGLFAFLLWRHLRPQQDSNAEDELTMAKLPIALFLRYVAMPYLVIGLLYLSYLALVWLNNLAVSQQTLPLTSLFNNSALTQILPGLVPTIVVALLTIGLTLLLLEYAIFELNPPLAIDSAERAGRFFKFYVRGTFFAIPIGIQVFSVLVFGFGLWASLDFNEEAATTVSLGTILSFAVMGGFVQAIGRLGLFYTEQKSFILAKEMAYRLIRPGIITMLVVGVVWYVFNLFVPYFPQRVILVSLTYYILLSTMWLFLAILYTLKERAAIILITIIGLVMIGFMLNFFALWVSQLVANWMPWIIDTIIAWLPSAIIPIIWLLTTITALVDGLGLTDPYRGIPWNIYAAHWIGLTVTILLTFLWGHRRLFKLAHWLRQQKTGHIASLKLARPPFPSITTYSVGPYFIYGFLYFTYLFADRLIGWSTSNEPLPLIIWFRTPYELGLDWALLALLITIALLEYTINEFGTIIKSEQARRKVLDVEIVKKSDAKLEPELLSTTTSNLIKQETEEEITRYPQDKQQETRHPFNNNFKIKTTRQIKAHNNFFFRFYIRQLALLTIIATVGILITYYGVLWFQRFDYIKSIRDFFANPITFSVFYWGIAGYTLLVYGILNNVFFFFMSRPTFTLKAIGAGIIVNIVVGFTLSRMLDYWYSVIGMTAGALVIAVITTIFAFRVLRKLDYYYYSAY